MSAKRKVADSINPTETAANTKSTVLAGEMPEKQ
jgi:hypothetical protein